MPRHYLDTQDDFDDEQDVLDDAYEGAEQDADDRWSEPDEEDQ